MRQRGIVLLILLASACDGGRFIEPEDPDSPTDLTYQLIPSGDPNAPAGIVLQWNPPQSGRAVSFDVYARSSTGEDFLLRATTTSQSFHDAGYPQLQYYVQALDEGNGELGNSNVVTVDERNRLPAPRALVSVTLNGGVQLSWDPNAADAAPELFEMYRVYSTSWSSAQGCDLAAWSLEGTTVSDAFVARNLPNGVTRCFAVSAISWDGHESVWSNVREDTPRYDARSIVVDASDVHGATSGFRFVSGSTGTVGTVVSDTTTGADLVLERRDGALWFRAARAEVRVAAYGTSPVSELGSIDRAPTTGYADAVRASAGFGYVVRIQYGDGIRYAAIRMVHVAADYVLFDFAFQSQAGNGELLRIAR